MLAITYLMIWYIQGNYLFKEIEFSNMATCNQAAILLNKQADIQQDYHEYRYVCVEK